MLYGNIHSFQSLGTVDGPGVRAVVFFQGCPLRCACCHNPDTWDFSGGTKISSEELAERVKRYAVYFGNEGGVTFSGGEVLCQSEFAAEAFGLLKAQNIHTAIDTSGCILNDGTKKLLSVTDLVILDIKYTNPADYLRYTGCEMRRVIEFLEYCNTKGIETWLRQVIIPGLNDNEQSVKEFSGLKKAYDCVSKTELLPFRKLCTEKYEALGIDFPLKDVPEADNETMERLNALL